MSLTVSKIIDHVNTHHPDVWSGPQIATTVAFICGFIVLGAAFQKKLSVGAVVMGWGLAEVAVMINTVAVCKLLAMVLKISIDSSGYFFSYLDAYCNDCFPRHKGEISALINLARTLGGFSVAYFQVPWATKNGALQTFGVEAA